MKLDKYYARLYFYLELGYSIDRVYGLMRDKFPSTSYDDVATSYQEYHKKTARG